MQKKYQIIYSDPPWEVLAGSKQSRKDGDSQKSLKLQYPTMSLEQIKAYHQQDDIERYKYKKISNRNIIVESVNDRLKFNILNKWFDTISSELTKYYYSMIPFFVLSGYARESKRANIDEFKTITVTDMPQELAVLNGTKIFFSHDVSDTSDYKRYTGIGTMLNNTNKITVNIPLAILDIASNIANDLSVKVKGTGVYNIYSKSFNEDKLKRVKIGNETGNKIFKRMLLEIYPNISKLVNTTIRNIVVHELIHRFDDTILPYSHKSNLLNNSDKIKTTNDYYNNNTEINAYIIGSLSELPSDINFDDVLKSPMIKRLLDTLTSDNKKRAYKRIYDIWVNKDSLTNVESDNLLKNNL